MCFIIVKYVEQLQISITVQNGYFHVYDINKSTSIAPQFQVTLFEGAVTKKKLKAKDHKNMASNITLNLFLLCLPKGPYTSIHSSGETTVHSVQEPVYEEIDDNGTESYHSYINVCMTRIMRTHVSLFSTYHWI